MTFIGGGTVILSGSNTYSGSTTVAGFVTAATPASLPGYSSTSTLVSVGPAAPWWSTSAAPANGTPAATDIASLMTSANMTAGATFGIDTTNAPSGFTYGGKILFNTADTGLVKLGPNTLVLTNSSNGYTGGTAVSAGTLEARSPGSLPLVTSGTG